MVPLSTLGLALLIFTTACEPAVGTNAATRNCYRKDCNGTQYDTQEATCCENKLHAGANLSCCGKEPYYSGTATCCKVQHEHTITVRVTQGLSEEVSRCCNLQAYNSVNEICCQSTITTKPAPMAECCGKEAFDTDKQLCCGPIGNRKILIKESIHHRCCSHNQFNEETQCCCEKKDNVLEVQPKNSTCCLKDSTAPAEIRPSTNKSNQSITTGGYDTKTLKCGPNRSVLVKKSIHHQCCGPNQFNEETHCCCENMGKVLEIQPKNSSCCANESARSEGAKQQTHELQHNCKEPNTHLCGSSCFNPETHRCCERNHNPHQLPASDQNDATAIVYDRHTQVCCDGRVSTWEPGIDQCCGQTPYGLAQRGVLCCNNILYKDREDGEECSEMGTPFNPAKGTICCSQFHGSPGQHCCGTEMYRPHTEICCNGHRHPKSKNIYCCGVKAYNIKDPQMKCCAGTLYNLTSLEKHGGDAQCCGSILQKPQEVCCSSQDKEVLYSAKTGFRCCGHLHYNTTLWSCCAGRLRPIHKAGQDQRKMTDGSSLLSVNNLNANDLCKEMHIGTVESVSRHSIVFKSVLLVHGKEANVTALPLPHILNTADHCSTPKLIPGKTYFFKGVTVFTDFPHGSVLQSLHFIMSKCSY